MTYTIVEPQDLAVRTLTSVYYFSYHGPLTDLRSRVHTKANLRIKLEDLLPLLPKIIRAEIRSSRYYVVKSNSLIIAADSSRTQSTNLQECYNKLYETIMEAGRKTVRGETAPGKVEKVKTL